MKIAKHDALMGLGLVTGAFFCLMLYSIFARGIAEENTHTTTTMVSATENQVKDATLGLAYQALTLISAFVPILMVVGVGMFVIRTLRC